jgi:hypothetical protein
VIAHRCSRGSLTPAACDLSKVARAFALVLTPQRLNRSVTREMLTRVRAPISIAARESGLRASGSAATLIHEKEIHFPIRLF